MNNYMLEYNLSIKYVDENRVIEDRISHLREEVEELAEKLLKQQDGVFESHKDIHSEVLDEAADVLNVLFSIVQKELGILDIETLIYLALAKILKREAFKSTGLL